MPGQKRLREGPAPDKESDDDAIFSWRGEARLADWTLQWGGRVVRVHRLHLAKACHFFRGATNEAFRGDSTDLSSLLPDVCEPLLDTWLDWVYGGDRSELLDALPDSSLPALYHMADVLQCTCLKRHAMEKLKLRTSVLDVSDIAEPLIDALVAVPDSGLFLTLLPLFPSQVLACRAEYIAKHGPPTCVPAFVGELARRVQTSVQSSGVAEFITRDWPSSVTVERQVRLMSKPVFCGGASFVLVVYTHFSEGRPRQGGQPTHIAWKVEMDVPEDAHEHWQSGCFGVRTAMCNWGVAGSSDSEKTWHNVFFYKFKPAMCKRRLPLDDFFGAGKGWIREMDRAVKFRFQVWAESGLELSSHDTETL